MLRYSWHPGGRLLRPRRRGSGEQLVEVSRGEVKAARPHQGWLFIQMEIGELRRIPDFSRGLISADRITQVDNTGHAVAELDVDQVVSDVMRSFDANHGQACSTQSTCCFIDSEDSAPKCGSRCNNTASTEWAAAAINASATAGDATERSDID